MALTDRPAASTAVEPRFPCFDGLRALAALAVLMTHVSFAGGANAPNLFGAFFARMDGGVAVFFVLSGVLIYRPFAACPPPRHAGTGRPAATSGGAPCASIPPTGSR